MSYTSQYNLNIRVSGLEGQINNLISTNNLNGVLTNGNSAGTNDIDMNGQDILDVNNIDVSTINGSAYPPVVASDTLQDVLNAGDTSDLSIILVDDLNTTTKQNVISGTDIILTDIPTGAISTLSSGGLGLYTPSSSANLSTTQLAINGAVQQIALNSSGGTIRSIDFAGYYAQIAPNIVLFNRPAGGGGVPVQTQLQITDQNVGYVMGGGGLSSSWTNIINAGNGNLAITEDNSNSTFYPVFVSNNTGNLPLKVDKSGTPLSYNPSTGVLSTTSISQPSGINITGGSYTFSQTSSSNLRLYTFQTNGTIEMYTGGSLSNLQLTAFGTGSFVNINGNGSGAGVNISSADGNTNFIGSGNVNFNGSGNVISNRPFTATNGFTSSSTNTGGVGSPNITLTNTSASAGNTNGVPSTKYNKSGRNAVSGDTIGSQHFFANNYLGTSTEFAKIESSVRNTGAENDDGSIGFSGLINGVQTEFFRVNGADSENNCFLPLDMNGQAIKSSTTNLTFSATGSTGTGSIIIQPKSATGDLQFDGTNIQSASAGGNSGQHLRIKLNGVYYKIQLLND